MPRKRKPKLGRPPEPETRKSGRLTVRVDADVLRAAEKRWGADLPEKVRENLRVLAGLR